MSVPFQCPSCMRKLQFSSGDSAFQNCPYCKGKIIVPSIAVHQEEIEGRKPTKYALQDQRDLKLAEIQTELRAGRKINAIKIFRETFGTGLKEAKEAVEAMEWGDSIDNSNSASGKNYAAMKKSPTEQQSYQNVGKENVNPGRAGSAIIWFLITLGFVLYMIFGGD